MGNYKMIVQYDGTRLNGWQRQGNTGNTVQGKLEQVLGKMAGHPVEVRGAGRTDAGVHAAAQVADFALEEQYACGYLLAYMNAWLPRDIAVQSVEPAPPEFHSRLNAKKKVYEYRIWNDPVRPVFYREYQWYIPCGRQFQDGKISELPPLDLTAMERAAADYVGTHDFSSFCTKKQTKKSPVRTVYSVNLAQNGPEIRITFCGNGFLYNMVRIMTGTLVEIGEGRRPKDDIPRILAERSRKAAGMTAPACGLTLKEIIYL